MSKTFLVFENGEYYSVTCSLHAPPRGHPKPVDAFIVTEHDGDFTIAARKAAHAVYNCARKRQSYENAVVAGFDLSERVGMDARMAGQSGGLCFAVCFAEKLLNIDPGSVAATGVIEADGSISRVKGLETKIRTAADLIKNDGLILFPEQNLPDITKGLQSYLEENNIKALPVSDIDQVFDILSDKKNTADKNKPFLNKPVLFVVLLFLALAVAISVWVNNSDRRKIKTESPVLEKKTVTENSSHKPLTEPVEKKQDIAPPKGSNDKNHIAESASEKETIITFQKNGSIKSVKDKGFE